MMKFTDEEADVEVPLTIGEMQIMMAAAWQRGYTEGYRGHRLEQDFDLTQNPWSEENDDY